MTSENRTEAEKKRERKNVSAQLPEARERNNDRIILLVWKAPLLLNSFKEGTQ